jgi:hypothetical protein
MVRCQISFFVYSFCCILKQCNFVSKSSFMVPESQQVLQKYEISLIEDRVSRFCDFKRILKHCYSTIQNRSYLLHRTFIIIYRHIILSSATSDLKKLKGHIAFRTSNGGAYVWTKILQLMMKNYLRQSGIMSN